MTNPLINIPESSATCPIHIMITKPGAIAGTDGQKEEIAMSLPKADEGKLWCYQPIAVQPLRFATVEDADKFMASLADKKPTDEFFVAPMLYSEDRKKWVINKNWAQAAAELVVFAQMDLPKGEAPKAEN